MPFVKQSKIVRFSPKQLYDLVDDINAYHTFLKGCKHSYEEKRTENTVIGTLVLAAPGFKQSFTTKNTLTPHECISLTLVKGPFRKLEGKWTFTPMTDNQTKVALELDFEFNSRLLAFTLGPAVHQLTNHLTETFCQQAAIRYGENNG